MIRLLAKMDVPELATQAAPPHVIDAEAHEVVKR